MELLQVKSVRHRNDLTPCHSFSLSGNKHWAFFMCSQGRQSYKVNDEKSLQLMSSTGGQNVLKIAGHLMCRVL